MDRWEQRARQSLLAMVEAIRRTLLTVRARKNDPLYWAIEVAAAAPASFILIGRNMSSGSRKKFTTPHIIEDRTGETVSP